MIHMERRGFLLSGLAALVALSTPNIVDKGVEMVARAEAEEPEKSPISEAEFNRLMAYDTVDDILTEYRIGSVDDSTYKRKVYDSDKHVMVLFYNNTGKGSKGLSVLAGLLSKEFDSQFEVFRYKMSEQQETPDNVLRQVYIKYGIDKTPIILLYKNSEIPNVNERVVGNILTYEYLIKIQGL